MLPILAFRIQELSRGGLPAQTQVKLKETIGMLRKAAQVIVQLTKEDKPPLRLLLGSDAYNGAEKNDLARLEEARKWKELSLSTDFGTR